MKGRVSKGCDVAPWFGRCFTHASPGAPSGKLETGLESKLRAHNNVTITVRGIARSVQKIFFCVAIIQILKSRQFPSVTVSVLQNVPLREQNFWEGNYLMNVAACAVLQLLYRVDKSVDNLLSTSNLKPYVPIRLEVESFSQRGQWEKVILHLFPPPSALKTKLPPSHVSDLHVPSLFPLF